MHKKNNKAHKGLETAHIKHNYSPRYFEKSHINRSNGLSQLTVNSTNVQNSQIKAVGGDGAFHFFTYILFMGIGLMFQLRRIAFESNTLIALPPPSILRSHAMLTSAGALTCTITVCIWIDTARNSVLCGNSLLNSSYGKLPGDLQVIPCIDWNYLPKQGGSQQRSNEITH